MRPRRSERPKRSGRRGDQPASAPASTGVPVIAGYGDLTVIGRGASATVYRATQENFGRTVAIKVLHVDVSDRRAQRRFEREREINGRLSHHPNVVTVLESGFVDGRYPYLAMEFFEHGSLSGRLAERGPFDIGEALHIGIRIAGALESAHGMGVLHRDVKPQNILLSRFGEPALADFGIATILELEQSVTSGLTPVHAAPEILEGADPSPSSDVYALGSTVYTLLSGAPPFAGPPGEGVLAQLLRITTMDLPAMGRTDVPPSLVLALRESTAKHPEDRTPTAAAFGRLLQMAQDDLGLSRTNLPLDVPADVPAPPRSKPAERPDPPVPASWSPPPVPAPAAGALPVVPMPVNAAPAVDMGDDTIGDDVDTPTVAGRQLQPVEPEERRSRRWVAVAAVSLAALVFGAIAAGAYTNGRRWHGEVAIGAEGTAPPLTDGAASTDAGEGKNDVAVDPAGGSVAASTDVTDAASTGSTDESATTESPVPDDPDEWAPQDVFLSTDIDPPTLHWTDMTGGVAVHNVRADRALDGWEQLFVDSGREVALILVAPDTDACFQVRAVLAVGVPQSGSGVAGWAVGDPAWVCMGDAVPPTTTSN